MEKAETAARTKELDVSSSATLRAENFSIFTWGKGGCCNRAQMDVSCPCTPGDSTNSSRVILAFLRLT